MPIHHALYRRFALVRLSALAASGAVRAEGQRAGSQTSLLPLVRMFALMSAERWVTARAA